MGYDLQSLCHYALYDSHIVLVRDIFWLSISQQYFPGHWSLHVLINMQSSYKRVQLIACLTVSYSLASHAYIHGSFLSVYEVYLFQSHINVILYTFEVLQTA